MLKKGEILMDINKFTTKLQEAIAEAQSYAFQQKATEFTTAHHA